MFNHSYRSELTSAQHEGLGKLFVEWSNLEFLLGLLLSRLLFTPEFLGRTYSDGMNAASLETAIKNALEIHEHRYRHAVVSEEQVNRIRKLIIDVAKCRALRNKFAHFLWLRVSDDEIAGYKMSGKPATKKQENEKLRLSLEDIEKNYRESYSLVEKLQELVFELPEVDEKKILARFSDKQIAPTTKL